MAQDLVIYVIAHQPRRLRLPAEPIPESAKPKDVEQFLFDDQMNREYFQKVAKYCCYEDPRVGCISLIALLAPLISPKPLRPKVYLPDRAGTVEPGDPAWGYVEAFPKSCVMTAYSHIQSPFCAHCLDRL